MVGRQQQLQKIFNKSPQTYGMAGEKQTGNLTPRETRGNGMNKECDGDGMSDFLGQQEHFQN